MSVCDTLAGGACPVIAEASLLCLLTIVYPATLGALVRHALSARVGAPRLRDRRALVCETVALRLRDRRALVCETVALRRWPRLSHGPANETTDTPRLNGFAPQEPLRVALAVAALAIEASAPSPFPVNLSCCPQHCRCRGKVSAKRPARCALWDPPTARSAPRAPQGAILRTAPRCPQWPTETIPTTV